MIVFDLRCDKGHVFEAWFADSARYESQRKRGQVLCPSCGASNVEKAPMAPNIALSKDKSAEQAKLGTPPSKEEMRATMVEAIKAQRKMQEMVEKNFDHVGERFPEVARQIHYGEAEKRNIYGDATPDEAKSLAEEGIEVGRIPWLPRSDA